MNDSILSGAAAENLYNFDEVVNRKGTQSLKWDRYRNTDVLPFWVADMDFKIAAPIQQALSQRLEHPLYGYTSAADELTDAVIAHLLRELDWQVDPEWLVWLPGVVCGMAVGSRAFCQPGDEIMVNPPIYHHFFDSHDDEQHVLRKVPLQQQGLRWTYDIPAMQAAISDKSRMLLMCSPHNPTGTVFTQSELQAVAELCQQQQMVIISDEIHCDLVIDPDARHIPTAVAAPEYADQIITLMSGSKAWNIAGLNCSFAVISNPEIRTRFEKSARSILPIVPPLAFVATQAAYAEGNAWRRELLCYLAGNYQFLSDSLATIDGLELHSLQATYLAWIDASALGLDTAQQYFEQHGVGMSAGEQFGQAHYLRLNFACSRTMLVQGVERIRAAVAALGSKKSSA